MHGADCDSIERPRLVADRYFYRHFDLTKLRTRDTRRGCRKGGNSAVGSANQVDWAHLQCANERSNIGGVRCHVEMLTVVGPRCRAEVAQIEHNVSITLGYYLALRLPDAMVGVRAVHEQNHGAGSLIHVSDSGAIYRHLLRRLWL